MSKCKGLTWFVEKSRLAAAMGIETRKCDACGKEYIYNGVKYMCDDVRKDVARGQQNSNKA